MLHDGTLTIAKAAPAPVEKTGPRSIADIIADLKKPLESRHLKTRGRGGAELTYVEWHTAVRHLDYFAPGWSYSVKSVTLVGNLVTVIASISIPCLEGEVTRDATGCEEIDAKSYGDAVNNAESMALKDSETHDTRAKQDLCRTQDQAGAEVHNHDDCR